MIEKLVIGTIILLLNVYFSIKIWESISIIASGKPATVLDSISVQFQLQ